MPTRVHAFIASLPAAWLRDHGGLPDDLDPAELGSPEGVSSTTQRRMLGQVALRGGEGALLSLASRLASVTDEPLWFVMLNSRDVADCIDKEQRFNRFFHTDHRLRVLSAGERDVELEHRGLSEAPTRIESLFVLGLHLELFRQIGCGGLSASLPQSQDPSASVYENGVATHALPPGGHARWRIAWRTFVPRREPLVGLDEVLLTGASPVDLEADSSLHARVRRTLCTDLLHRWTVTELAKALGLSPRSLQRGLASDATSFSQVLDEARVETACTMLRDPRRSLTEIGYLCGFSDSAHFSRRFRALMGVSPSEWRKHPSLRVVKSPPLR